MEKNEKKESLEEMFAVLEKTVNQMETEELSLEDSFALYHKGMVLDEEGETHEFEM